LLAGAWNKTALDKNYFINYEFTHCRGTIYLAPTRVWCPLVAPVLKIMIE
jgi:hypothetical protein